MDLVQMDLDGKRSEKRHQVADDTRSNEIKISIGDLKLTLKKLKCHPFLETLDNYSCVDLEIIKYATPEQVLEGQCFLDQLKKKQRIFSPEHAWKSRLGQGFSDDYLKCLRDEKSFIQSEIITQYALHLLITSNCDPSKITLIEPYFYDRVVLENDLVAREKMRSKLGDISFLLDSQVLLFPINVNNNHWILVGIDLTKKVITFYDSIKSSSKKWYEDISHNLQERMIPNEILRRSGVTLKKVDFQPYRLADCCQQNDGFSCGIFVCRYLEVLIEDVSTRKGVISLPTRISNCFNSLFTPKQLRKKILNILEDQHID